MYLDAHARLKCATRSTPWAWFRHPTVDVPCVGIELNNSDTDDDLLRGGNLVYQQHQRRVAFIGDDDDMPRFNLGFYEAVTGHFAGLVALAGLFSEASDVYRSLGREF